MRERRSGFMAGFVIRAVVGCAMIFFINQFLEMKGISIQVGMNPVTVLTSGVLGAPGVALLYGVLFYGGL